MNKDEIEDADAVIDAARLLLATMYGQPVPALVAPSVLRGLVQIAFRALQLAVLMAEADPDNREIQDLAIRNFLERVIAGNMLLLNGLIDPSADNGSLSAVAGWLSCGNAIRKL